MSTVEQLPDPFNDIAEKVMMNGVQAREIDPIFNAVSEA